MTEFFSEERRVWIFGMLALRVDGNETVVAIPVEESDFVGALQNFKRKAAGVVPGNPSEDAKALRIDRGGEVMFQRRFPRGR